MQDTKQLREDDNLGKDLESYVWDILDTAYAIGASNREHGTSLTIDSLHKRVIRQLKEALATQRKEILEEVRNKVIGEDEEEPIVRDSQGEIEFEESVEGFRNDLRAEQRQKLSLLENARKT